MPQVTPVSIVIAMRNITNLGAEFYMQKRIENGPLNGLWEFPGGKITGSESPRVVALQKFKEETSDTLDIKEYEYFLFNKYQHSYNDRSVCLYVYIMRRNCSELVGGHWINIPFNIDIDHKFAYKVLDANKIIIYDLLLFLKDTIHNGGLKTLWKTQSD